jgi:hypothetical protein
MTLAGSMENSNQFLYIGSTGFYPFFSALDGAECTSLQCFANEPLCMSSPHKAQNFNAFLENEKVRFISNFTSSIDWHGIGQI